jgi:hypothetical protein
MFSGSYAKKLRAVCEPEAQKVTVKCAVWDVDASDR